MTNLFTFSTLSSCRLRVWRPGHDHAHRVWHWLLLLAGIRPAHTVSSGHVRASDPQHQLQRLPSLRARVVLLRRGPARSLWSMCGWVLLHWRRCNRHAYRQRKVCGARVSVWLRTIFCVEYGLLACDCFFAVWLHNVMIHSQRLFVIMHFPLSYPHFVLKPRFHSGDVCPSGHYCPPGSPAPLPCPTGTYSPAVGLSSPAQCTQCPPGSMCDVPGSYEVSGPCTAGYYCVAGVSTPQPFTNSTGMSWPLNFTRM